MQIKWAQKRDAGMYECQVCLYVTDFPFAVILLHQTFIRQISTVPIKSYSVRLNVVGKLFRAKK